MIMLNPDQMRAWVTRALPGEDVAYACGERPGPDIARTADALYQAGLVALTSRRVGGELRFIAQRRADPRPSQVRARTPVHRGRFAAREVKGRRTADRLILKLLVHAADKGLPCPTNADLAKRVGLAGAKSASDRVRRLVAAGKIRIEDPFEGRIVIIVATGRRTGRGKI